MPLQSRVTPFSEIIAVPDRGMLMGNRGVLHDHQRQIVRLNEVADVLTRVSIVNVIKTGDEPELHHSVR